MDVQTVATAPYNDQQAGTAGLRKKVKVFRQPHYLANYIQSVFDTVGDCRGKSMALGSDGRYFSGEAISIIAKMAAANGFARVLIGRNGFLSTPAMSLTIRKHELFGGFVLTASHNPGGPDRDFGIKYAVSNGSQAPRSVSETIYQRTLSIESYRTLQAPDPVIDRVSTSTLGDMIIEVIDPVSDYAELMEELFDFDRIRDLLTSADFTMRFDGMNGVTGLYAKAILQERLGAAPDTVVNGDPMPDFGGRHPDPNLIHARDLVDFMNGPNAADFAAAADGDGDRSMQLGRAFYVTPSDNIALLTANAHLAPGYSRGLAGVARSMVTGEAVDHVAAKLQIPCYETPTGWKFFGNLLDAGKITLCGEESFGAGSDHIREKDALWTVLFWLNILACRKESVADIVRAHWREYGRNFYMRHDYEAIDKPVAQALIENLRRLVKTLPGSEFGSRRVKFSDDFSYTDPIDNSIAANQGIRIIFEDGSRILYRLSGTGTVGTTVRVYFERYEPDPAKHDQDVREVLKELVDIADRIGEIGRRTERTGPDVIV